MKEKRALLLGGALTGVIAIVLMLAGNPANMGFCVACFLRDTAGAFGLHSAPVVQAVRPEIIGLTLGALIMALWKKDFSPRGGSAPATRFLLGMGVMIGSLIFLGCPFRMALRLAGGDGNAIFGLVGFTLGIGAGVLFLNRGFSLGRSFRQGKAEGFVFPGVQLAVLLILLFVPSILHFSEKGPGSFRAPIALALLGGLIVGAIAQRTRLCMVGGIRDVMLFRDWTLLLGFIAIFAAALVMNLLTGNFHPGFAGQPIAHTEWLWNILGMSAVGFGSVLLGGCPMRQLILAGEGSSDSATAIFGMIFGAALSHTLGLAASPDGVPTAGKIACVLTLCIMAVIAVTHTKTHKA